MAAPPQPVGRLFFGRTLLAALLPAAGFGEHLFGDAAGDLSHGLLGQLRAGAAVVSGVPPAEMKRRGDAQPVGQPVRHDRSHGRLALRNLTGAACLLSKRTCCRKAHKTVDVV